MLRVNEREKERYEGQIEPAIIANILPVQQQGLYLLFLFFFLFFFPILLIYRNFSSSMIGLHIHRQALGTSRRRRGRRRRRVSSRRTSLETRRHHQHTHRRLANLPLPPPPSTPLFNVARARARSRASTILLLLLPSSFFPRVSVIVYFLPSFYFVVVNSLSFLIFLSILLSSSLSIYIYICLYPFTLLYTTLHLDHVRYVERRNIFIDSMNDKENVIIGEKNNNDIDE